MIVLIIHLGLAVQWQDEVLFLVEAGGEGRGGVPRGQCAIISGL
jgi:hypothetical protein